MDNEELTTTGEEAVHFRIIRNAEDINNKNEVFHPDMCHQVFGQSELIYGYKDLKINIIYDASTFQCYVTSSYSLKVKTDPVTGLGPDDYMEHLNPWLPTDYYTEQNEFIDLVQSTPKLKPFGEIITTFTTSQKKTYQLRIVDFDDDEYTELHQRMETLIVWFIDAASYIDTTDKKWKIFVMYEKVNEDVYYPVGFATVYEYFAYPDRRRYRISQFIIFPPYQRLGLGLEMLRGIYKHLTSIPVILDITVEDPNDKFQVIRDILDIENCKTLPSFTNKSVLKGYSRNMIKEAKDHFKICEKQVRRVFEILRLEATPNDTYSIDIYKNILKARLKIPYEKREMQIKRQKLFSGAKVEITRDIITTQHKEVDEQIEELMEQYTKVLAKMEEYKQRHYQFVYH